MRIVLDLQGAQSCSRNRGIGRYTLSLAQAIARNCGEHEVIVAISALFPETIAPIRSAFDKIVSPDNMRVWHSHGQVGYIDSRNGWRRKSAELVREAFIASLNPDMVYIGSMFEGTAEDVISSVGAFCKIPTAVTLHDLIPLIHKDIYLQNESVNAWYQNKLQHLRRADLLLANSASSRLEGMKYLGFSADEAINVSAAADAHFRRVEITLEQEQRIRARLGLTKQFVMYTGGIDFRKNNEGLIRSYALLPKSVRENHQLAIVCSVDPGPRQQLEDLATQHGLKKGEVVLTGFITEDDLVALYNLCKVFIFPSWHEGFGLPILEAMHCGAPVIGANGTSIPEVIGFEEALFDPHSDTEIAKKIFQVINDSVFRDKLIRHGVAHAKTFSWDISAKKAIAAFEDFHSRKIQASNNCYARRPKLAVISPLPPERSGIADYCAELLPALAVHYDIDVITAQDNISDIRIRENCAIRSVDWFSRNGHVYERVLYHFGNSDKHDYMFELLQKIPGVVVLHDFFLSGIIRHMDWCGITASGWPAALYNSHGYHALLEHGLANDISSTKNVEYKYPCNSAVLEKAQGVIVHSNYPVKLANLWNGDNSADDWTVIPLLRGDICDVNRAVARKAFGFDEGAFIVCSFGFIGAPKLSCKLLNVWLETELSHASDCLLIFVGENEGGVYGEAITAKINGSPDGARVIITGWTDTKVYRQYLQIADLAVQLRTNSRGETSAAVLDCLSYGIPTIVNANGSFGELPTEAVWMLEDQFTDNDLANAIESLKINKDKRKALSQNALRLVADRHGPRHCAEEYRVAIETYNNRGSVGRDALIKSLAALDGGPIDEAELLCLAENIAANESRFGKGHLFVDVTGFVVGDKLANTSPELLDALIVLLKMQLPKFRIEPVYSLRGESFYRYARKFALQLLSCPCDKLIDDVIEVFRNDAFIALAPLPEHIVFSASFFKRLTNIGVKTYFSMNDMGPRFHPENFSETAQMDFVHYIDIVAKSDGAFCLSAPHADDAHICLAHSSFIRDQVFKIAVPDFTIRHVDTDSGERSSASQQIARCIIDLVVEGRHSRQWISDGTYRFFGSDIRLRTQVGNRLGKEMQSTGDGGCLIYGPYLSLNSGSYVATFYGKLNSSIEGAFAMDVTTNCGSEIKGRLALTYPDADDRLGSIMFSLGEPCSDVEIRAWAAPSAEASIFRLEVRPA